jgi:hypothetical protein
MDYAAKSSGHAGCTDDALIWPNSKFMLDCRMRFMYPKLTFIYFDKSRIIEYGKLGLYPPQPKIWF